MNKYTAEQTRVSNEGIRRVLTRERTARISFIQKYIKPKEPDIDQFRL